MRRFVQGDYAPAVLLVAVMVLLGAFIFAQNDRYLGAFNISAMLLLVWIGSKQRRISAEFAAMRKSATKDGGATWRRR